MPTKTIPTTSVRIPKYLKQSIQNLADFQETTQTNIITNAIEKYIMDNQKNINKSKIAKIQSSISQNENWTASEEINALDAIRKNKKI
jgi:predicted DNA-binding protein